MVSNYLKVALRSFRANKLYVFINITALTVAMTCGIVAYVNYDFAHSYDVFHSNIDELYVFRSITATDRGHDRIGITPRPLGPALKNDFPQIKHMTRILLDSEALRVDDKVFNEATYYVDKDFLTMFTFNLLAGDANALSDRSKIILTQKTARKYFGDEDPLGKVMTHQVGQKTVSYVVGAVLEDIPSGSSIQFDALLSDAVLDNAGLSDQSWNEWSHETIVQIGDPALLPRIREKLPTYVEHQKAANASLPLSELYIEPMREVADHSRDLTNDVFKEGMHPAAVFGPTITSILLLITACFNFMNTSLAFSAVRLKEVGIRKVLGSVRSQLVIQFIGENLILCAVSLLFAIGLAEIFVPAYGDLWLDFDLSLRFSENWGLFLFLGCLLLAMSIFSGAYPALFVSRFSPASILSGRQRFSRRGGLMQTILTFQFSLSVMTILTGIVFTSNASFLEDMNLGFDSRQTIAVPLQDTGLYETLRNTALQNPDVHGAEGARHVVGYSQSTRTARSGGIERRVAVFQGGYEYLSVMNLTLIQGRKFDRGFQTDQDDAVIITRKFASEFQWDNPIGQRITIDSLSYSVVGMVEDFYNRNVWRPFQPSAILLANPQEYRYLIVRADFANLKHVNEYLRQAWQGAAPNVPYEGFYGSEMVANAISISSTIRLVFIYVSGVAIAIAAMGLFAMSSLIIVRRTKEIGVRKVLGAPVFHIVTLLNRQVAIVLVLSGVLATIGGSFMIGMFLDSIYAYHISIQFWHYALAAGIVLLIGLATVSSQVYRVATSNPVDALRYE